MKQLVLAVRKSLFNEIGYFQGYTLDPQRYLDRMFAPGGSAFILRDDAEVDAGYKQLIPYVVLVCGGRVLSYVRGKESDEARLHSLRSIGFGGHIEPLDESLFVSPLLLYRKAAEREVLEEVKVQTTYTERVVGLINDDSNEVGRVHLGIVHVWSLAEPLVVKRERQIAAMRFLSPPELEKLGDRLEPWSRFAIEMIQKELNAPVRLPRPPGFADGARSCACPGEAPKDSKASLSPASTTIRAETFSTVPASVDLPPRANQLPRPNGMRAALFGLE